MTSMLVSRAVKGETIFTALQLQNREPWSFANTPHNDVKSKLYFQLKVADGSIRFYCGLLYFSNVT